VNWELRPLNTVEELEDIVDLEIRVWDLDPRDAVPSNLLHAMANTGSLIVGAYNSDDLIGMAFAFPIFKSGKRILWSHMTGVHPDHQGQGVGFALKQYQRTWALEHGISEIRWTFDPLQRGNANFNLHCLGATTNIYYVHFYGDMGGINAGLPSDRVEVSWLLRNPRVKQLARSSRDTIFLTPPTVTSLEPEITIVRFRQGHGLTLDLPESWGHRTYYVELPGNLKFIKQTQPELALQWRLAVRSALQAAFSRGYVATDVVESQGRYAYVLTAPEQWYLYVVRCQDDTLYTGIATDIQERVNRHNAGKGAAYTSTRRPVVLIGAWQMPNRSAAMKAEARFKKLTRSQKLELISQREAFADGLFIDELTF
jgi:predicted GNAT superfamily acetyltransferase/predicted GIY-YIG superfamily endonuclease